MAYAYSSSWIKYLHVFTQCWVSISYFLRLSFWGIADNPGTYGVIDRSSGGITGDTKTWLWHGWSAHGSLTDQNEGLSIHKIKDCLQNWQNYQLRLSVAMVEGPSTLWVKCIIAPQVQRYTHASDCESGSAVLGRFSSPETRIHLTASSGDPAIIFRTYMHMDNISDFWWVWFTDDDAICRVQLLAISGHCGLWVEVFALRVEMFVMGVLRITGFSYILEVLDFTTFQGIFLYSLYVLWSVFNVGSAWQNTTPSNVTVIEFEFSECSAQCSTSQVMVKGGRNVKWDCGLWDMGDIWKNKIKCCTQKHEITHAFQLVNYWIYDFLDPRFGGLSRF